MNVYTDDTILLSQESTERLLTTLLKDEECISLRDKFIADVQNNVTFGDDGSIVVNIPEIDISGYNYQEKVKINILNTKNKRVIVKTATISSNSYRGMLMYSYKNTPNQSKEKYIAKKSTPTCKDENTKQLAEAS